MYAIETQQLTRAFGDFTAVNHIDLQVPSAGVYCFLGPNGAGKTTTIRMLLGLIKADAGNISLLGKPASGSNIELKKGIGSLVESPSYYAHLTGRENLQIIRHMRQATHESVDNVLGIVNLAQEANKLVKKYSFGMKQRLAIAMTLIGNPRLLILDEPTNGLDPAGILEIRSLIKQLAHRDGLAVFVSSHLLSEVEQIADSIGIINHGDLIFQGSKTDLQAEFSSTASLKLDHPDEGVKLLQQQGWSAKLNDQEVIVQTSNEADLAIIIKQLVTDGYIVFQAGLKTPSLEDIFLKKVQIGG